MAVIPFFTAGQAPTAEALDNACSTGAVVFHAFRDANQSISSTTDAGVTTANAISWDDIQIDRQGSWSAGNPTRFTCQFAGWYVFNGAVGFNASTAGSFRQATWFKNGTLLAAGRGTPLIGNPIANNVMSVYARFLPLSLVVGDYVELVGGQDSGGALNTATGSYRSSFSVVYGGPT